MARTENDREDLLREAGALFERAQWQFADEPGTIVVGFRRSGAFSVYFGSDFMYQFDVEGRLRRAFIEGRLYRAQGTTLAELDRVRTTAAVELRRTDLDSDRLAKFVAAAALRLARLKDALASDNVVVIGQVPPDLDLRPRIQKLLTDLLSRPLQIAPAFNS